ncbi:hypothetical protein D3C71_905840 [compost metagenome]
MHAVGDPSVPSIGFCDLSVKPVEVLEKLDSDFLALRHQLNVCGGIAERRGLRTGNHLIDAVEVFHQALLDQSDPPYPSVDDDPGAAALSIFDQHASAAVADQHQFFKVQVLGLRQLDVVHAKNVGIGSKRLALLPVKAEVMFQHSVGTAGLGPDAPGVGIGSVGQRQLASQRPIRPPAWQPAANGGGPERVEAVSHVAEHRAATGSASCRHGAVHRIMGFPVAGFIQGDGLFVGSGAGCTQAPLRWVVGQFDAIDTTLADHEVAVGVAINVAINPFGARLQAGEGNLVFVLIAPEAFEGASDLLRGRDLQGARLFGQGAQLSPASGGARGTGSGANNGQYIHGSVDQRQQHGFHLGQAMADITAQEGRRCLIGAVPGVVQGNGGTDERHDAQRHFQVVEHGPGAQRDVLQIQGIVGARCRPMRLQQTAHVHIEQMRCQGCTGWPGGADADQGIEVFHPGLVDPADVRGKFPGQGATGQVVDHRAVQALVEEERPRLFKAVELTHKHPIGAVRPIEQGQAADLLDDKSHPGQGARPLARRVRAANGQVRGQQHDALAVDRKGFTTVGVDGDLQHALARDVDVLGQHGEFAVQLEHQPPRFVQAFTTKFIAEGRGARGAKEGLANQPFVFPGQIQLGDHVAQVVLGDAGFQFLPLRLVGAADLDPHQRHPIPHRLIDIALRQFGEGQQAALFAAGQYILLRCSRRCALDQHLAPRGGVGDVQQHFNVLRQGEVFAQAGVDSLFAE